METLWIADDDFKKYIDEAGDKADLQNIDGYNRWVITGGNGVQYIVRPQSAHEDINITEMPA